MQANTCMSSMHLSPRQLHSGRKASGRAVHAMPTSASTAPARRTLASRAPGSRTSARHARMKRGKRPQSPLAGGGLQAGRKVRGHHAGRTRRQVHVRIGCFARARRARAGGGHVGRDAHGLCNFRGTAKAAQGAACGLAAARGAGASRRRGCGGQPAWRRGGRADPRAGRQRGRRRGGHCVRAERGGAGVGRHRRRRLHAGAPRR